MPGVPGLAAFTPTEQGPGLAKVAPERQLSQHDASILQNALEVLFSSLHSRHAMLQAFRRIDTDGDKHIGAAEFLKACRILGLALSAKAGKLVVQLLDRSGDGTVPCSVSIARPRFWSNGVYRTIIQCTYVPYRPWDQSHGTGLNYHDLIDQIFARKEEALRRKLQGQSYRLMGQNFGALFEQYHPHPTSFSNILQGL
jgi:hypothetical protein